MSTITAAPPITIGVSLVKVKRQPCREHGSCRLSYVWHTLAKVAVSTAGGGHGKCWRVTYGPDMLGSVCDRSMTSYSGRELPCFAVFAGGQHCGDYPSLADAVTELCRHVNNTSHHWRFALHG